MRTRTRLSFFAHHKTSALLKTLGLQRQAIKKQFVSSPFGPIISGQLFDKASQFLAKLRWHLPGNRAYPRVIQNNRA